jgi:hypothetical protein
MLAASRLHLVAGLVIFGQTSLAVAACGKSSTGPQQAQPVDAALQDCGWSPDGDAGAPSHDAPDVSAQAHCVDDVPPAQEAGPVVPNTTGPIELWRKTVGAAKVRGELVLVGDRLVLSLVNSLVALNRKGEKLWSFVDPGVQLSSAPVADAQGNVFVVNTSAYSFDSSGQVRWKVPLGGNLDTTHETTYTNRALLSPDGYLVFAASDGFLYALKASDGMQRWRRSIGLNPQKQAWTVTLGVGDTVFVGATPYALTSGEPGKDASVSDHSVPVRYASYDGLIASDFQPVGDTREERSYSLDFCLKSRWAPPNTGGSWHAGVVLPDNVTAFTLYPTGAVVGSPAEGYLYSAAGQVLVGPKPMRGVLSAAGADGTIYSLECSSPDQAAADLGVFAYSPTMEPKWTLNIGPGCMQQSATLADDGVLYVLHPVATNILELELVAIQTGSPGLIRSAMPTLQFDNRRTGWLGSP